MKKIILFFLLMQISLLGFTQNPSQFNTKVIDGEFVKMNAENGSVTYQISKEKINNNGIQLSITETTIGKLMFSCKLYCIAKNKDPFLYSFGYKKDKQTNEYNFEGTEKLRFNTGDKIYIEDIIVFNADETYQSKLQAFIVNVVD